MSVIPVSRLSCSDLALLGNNFRPARGPGAATTARRRQRRMMAAVNRSLAGHARGEERVWLFDLLRVGPAGWRLGSGALERFDALRATAPAGLIVPHALAGYEAFFESSKLDPCTEGVVLKRVDSRYIGSARACRDNPAWLKVKWRDGAGGNKRIA